MVDKQAGPGCAAAALEEYSKVRWSFNVQIALQGLS